MKSGFVDKLLHRLDKLDRDSLQTHFMRMVQERGLLETIFQSIQEGIIVVDREGKLTYANRAAEGLVGFSFEQFEGRPISRAIRDIDWDQILDVPADEWARMISRELEVTYPQHRFISFYVVPLAFGGESGGGAVVILRDVTHEREQEADLVESERLNAVKLLAAGVAHEIGNPLNALNIHLQLLQREMSNLPDEWRASMQELVSVASAETQRLDLIITQFLRALRPAPPNFASASVPQLLKDTLVVMRQEFQNRNITVQVDQPGELPDIQVDRDQIKQVFFNILKNAVQAMPDGGRLRVGLTASDRYLLIEFEDTGEGIRPEDFGRIFEPYQTTKPEGSGLGLMIVQRIVQDHGGQIDLQSKRGEGTRFTVRLPLSDRRVRLLGGSEPTRAVS